MQNLTQIKSRQLGKYATIDPVVQCSSNHILQVEKNINKHLTLINETNENNYEIANFVKQILQSKPKTAPKIGSKKIMRNRKTQIIDQSKPSAQFYCNNPRPNLLNKKQSEDNEEDRAFKTSLSKQKRHFNFLQIDNRLNSTTSKSSRTLKREYYRNSIQAIDNVDKEDQAKKLEKQRQKLFSMSNTDDSQCRIRITKRKTELCIPRSKISIKNLDKQIEVPKQFQSKNKKAAKYDLNLPKLSYQTRQFQEDFETDLKGWKQKRSKKSITDFKVPEFIKISLQSYQQEPTYLIEELEKRKNRQKSAEKTDQKEEIKEEPLQNISIVKREENDTKQKQEQKIVSNKLRLFQKEKKKPTIVVQAQANTIQDRNIPISQESKAQQSKIEKKKAKPKKDDILEKINICGWEEQDPNIPQPHFFKL